MTETAPSIEIRLTPEFQRKFKALRKKYRKIQADLQPILEDLQTGSLPGDQIPGITDIVMKLRVKNSDTQKGKSGGYRLIYWILSTEIVVLIDIYSKSDQSNIEVDEICQIIKGFSRNFPIDPTEHPPTSPS
jgi:mRNA-degrading endonuclease RelE of RelBE toxin-antitoxin system